MVYHRNWMILAGVIFGLVSFLPSVQAEPPLIEGNPGLPGCLAKVDQLEQMLDAMQNYAPVPQTGQTVSYATGDDGDLKKGVLWPVPRFTDNGNGTVTDNLTKLVWLKNANCFGSRSWTDALSACNTLASPACGLTDGSVAGDWRLPNIRELYSLIHYGVYDPALSNTNGTRKWVDGDPFTGVLCSPTGCAQGFYWSSTTIASSEDALYIYLGGGFVGELSKLHNGYFVWPVRDAK